MSRPDTEGRLSQLDQQQALLTDALAKMLTGEWTGFPSVQANLEALSPGIELAPRPPLLSSEAGPETPPPFLSGYDPAHPMPGQLYDWNCSAAALSWVLRATGTAPGHDPDLAAQEIGYPHNINETYGLMDGSGAQLRRVLSAYGLPSWQAWLTFDAVWAAMGETCGLMSGGAWYHWVGLRGRDGPNLWVANSAQGWKGVYSTVTREQFAWLGPFSVVLLGD